MSLLLEVYKVSKEFDGIKALDNVSFQLRLGESLGVLGRSGSGKSVLMQMIRGVKGYEPTEGYIIYYVAFCPSCSWVDIPTFRDNPCPQCGTKMEYRVVNLWEPLDNDVAEALKARVAIMFQRTFALYGNLTPIENVMEALKRARIDERVAPRLAFELLKLVNLTHRLLHPAEALSGGEKQRVVLARQIAVNPILLLADEPTGTLDPYNAHLVSDLLIKEFKAKNKCMIVASHIPTVLQRLCDRIIWLEKGKMIMDAPSPEVISSFLKGVQEPQMEQVPTGNEILRVIDVSKYYYSIDRGLTKAVDHVTFNVKEREIFGIVGKSGAGKTTLSRIICGVTEPSSGVVELKVGDRWYNITKPGYEGRAIASSYIGLLHQEYALYPYRTVLDNLSTSIGLELPEELARMKVMYTLKSVGFNSGTIDQVLTRYPDELSEGERHRVALAQVLIKEPRVVVLDEPSGTMDPITKIEVAKSILSSRSWLDETFIIVSHDIDFVRLVCDRLALMKNGRIVAYLDPKKTSWDDLLIELRE
ncbi:MAG: methyl coenzyme M reductase system, component A2 [Candidatus Nezhaarchaeota archaeon]|nr:methyl coenzyme M reductase system, component A2 [Candidatus Nezhaarchaeota archaeon]MCX8141661.1 methyl coenzyme M reductase system, component A2 [Candidatus Nezhaarchaeota archaeon]MDW8049928.1 methyl coenzyme M reductase system, component A2 [Nitrososphaerota archaeon]